MSKQVTVGGSQVKAKRIKSGLYLLGHNENENVIETIVICRNNFILRNPYNTKVGLKEEPIRILSMEDNVITTENVDDEFYYAIFKKTKYSLSICKIAKNGSVENDLLSREDFFLPQKRTKIHKEVAKIMTDLALPEAVASN